MWRLLKNLILALMIITSVLPSTTWAVSDRPAVDDPPPETKTLVNPSLNTPSLRRAPRPTPAASTQNRTAEATTNATEPGEECVTIDFEGVGDNSPIPEFDGITSPGFLGIVDSDDGGSGNIAFEPSPSTVAYWPYGDTWRYINFADPVSKIMFHYTSVPAVNLEAFDAAGQLVASATGLGNYDLGPGGDPTGDYNKWDMLGVSTDENIIKSARVSGELNQTAIDDLIVCWQNIHVNSVEFTQAIQEWQTVGDLQADLAGDGEPPVPVLAGKPLALRIYMEPVKSVTQVRVKLSGVTSADKTVTLQPGCTVEKARRQQDNCASADFYFTPPPGQWTATVTVLDMDENEIESHSFHVTSRQTSPLTLQAVSVCDAQDAKGKWQCATANTLPGLMPFLRSIAPTSSVQATVPGDQVRKKTSSYSRDADWWIAVLADLVNLGSDGRYYGMVRAEAPGDIGGFAQDSPSRAAASRISTTRLGVETNAETVAHETGHMLGQRHTNTDAPRASSTPPGCYNLAETASTVWPYSDNTIQSGPASASRLETGFDVAAQRALEPDIHYEVMSYCTPRWISPMSYRGGLESLAIPPAAPANAVAAFGQFWQISGLIENGTVTLAPIFTLETKASSGNGSGSHRIEVRSGSGTVLFTRFFQPAATLSETIGDDVVGPPMFAEWVPVQDGAARIIIFDGSGTSLRTITLGGSAPSVTILSPAGSGIWEGDQMISWSASDPDSTDLTFLVQYSADGGESWHTLMRGLKETSLSVDFDDLPGSQAASLIRVYASDGVNTGVATSQPFSVKTEPPTAEIIFPPDGSIYQRGALVWFQGLGFDGDDGVLSGDALRWTSSIDGLLGNGDDLRITTLSEGRHTITLDVTDSDGNSASDMLALQVDGTPPQLDLTVTPDGTPASCVTMAIDAKDEAEGSGLRSVGYSLDSGETWKTVPLDALPYQFYVPGSGYFHVLAFAVDDAGNLSAADQRFFIETPCDLTNPPTASAGGPYSVLEGGSVDLSGSGTDVDDDVLTYAWDLDNDGTYETAGQTVTFSAATLDGPDTQPVVLRVCDDQGGCGTSTADVTITNVAPVATNDRPSQEVQAGQPIAVVTGTYSDVTVDFPLTVTPSWTMNGGAAQPGLPPGLAVAAPTCTPSGARTTCTISTQPGSTLAMGNYVVTVTVSDGDGGTATTQIAITVSQAKLFLPLIHKS